jgi:uncharacterized membrane protein YoaT (DUF817 family)
VLQELLLVITTLVETVKKIARHNLLFILRISLQVWMFYSLCFVIQQLITCRVNGKFVTEYLP